VTLTVHDTIDQGTEEWLALRRGMVTASVVGQLISTRAPSAIGWACFECGAFPGDPCISRARKEPAPIKTLHASRVTPDDAPLVIEAAANDTSRALTNLLVAERITGWTDPVYVSDDMFRGQVEEPIAREVYSKHYAPVRETGFMVRDDWGFNLGYSPDGLVGDDGLIEIKSRLQKKHLATILADAVPLENMAQLQAGLLVSGRAWIDYVSFCAGMPLWVKRVYPDQGWQDAIVQAVTSFEETAAQMFTDYYASVKGLAQTERVDHAFAGIEF
jgi:hypothetical protein